MKTAQVIKHDNATLFSVYNNGNLGLPIVANCPIINLDKALSLYDENHTIRLHSIKYIINWVL